jgi:hypothetical protein
MSKTSFPAHLDSGPVARLIRHCSQRTIISSLSNAPARRAKAELRKRMHDPIVNTGAWVWQMLNGHLGARKAP